MSRMLFRHVCENSNAKYMAWMAFRKKIKRLTNRKLDEVRALLTICLCLFKCFFILFFLVAEERKGRSDDSASDDEPVPPKKPAPASTSGASSSSAFKPLVPSPMVAVTPPAALSTSSKPLFPSAVSTSTASASTSGSVAPPPAPSTTIGKVPKPESTSGLSVTLVHPEDDISLVRVD